MGKGTRYVGMDVHAETIAVAIVEGRKVARSLGTIPNRPEAVRRLVGKLGDPSTGLRRTNRTAISWNVASVRNRLKAQGREAT